MEGAPKKKPQEAESDVLIKRTPEQERDFLETIAKFKPKDPSIEYVEDQRPRPYQGVQRGVYMLEDEKKKKEEAEAALATLKKLLRDQK